MSNWATGWGHRVEWSGSGVEGTGSYGAGLARYLTEHRMSR